MIHIALMKNFIYMLALATLLGSCQDNLIAKDIVPYTQLKKPSEQPSIFLAGLVSVPERYEFGSVLSADFSEFYFAVEHGGWAEIMMIQKTPSGWSQPVSIIGSADFSANDPFLSNDNSRLYFITNKGKHYDIGYLERTGKNNWGSAVFPVAPINSPANEYYISFTKNDDMVFASDRKAGERGDFDIYMARKDGDQYLSATVFPDTINTKGYEADAFIAPDESYLIFSSNRKGGLGKGDLYISFSTKNGGWTKAVSMGEKINTPGHELCPFVSADGQYFFYTSREDIYWINANIISSLRAEVGDLP